MAEERFTSRRARREAERLAAEQAFEARSAPSQSEETAGRSDLFVPPPLPTTPPTSETAEDTEPSTSSSTSDGTEDVAEAPADLDAGSADTAGSADDEATDSSVSADDETTDSSVSAAEASPEDRLDPSPTPAKIHERGALASDHLQAERQPVLAEDRLDPTRTPLPHFSSRAERKRYLRERGLSTEGDTSTGAFPVLAEPVESGAADAEAAPASTEASSTTTGSDDEPEVDAAGFAGDADEIAARDFEAPVDAGNSPRPAADTPAFGRPTVDDSAAKPDEAPAQTTEAGDEAAASDSDDASAVSSGTDEPDPGPRSRRMPIVQPPTTSGVRVVTAASARVPDIEPAPAESAPKTDDGAAATDAAPSPLADGELRSRASNPETRPMDTVPEAWALPNADYEDEETLNPPGQRVRASAVTGHDGKILVGEEPSKVPFVVLGVAALVAVSLIVIALVMLL